MVVGGSLNVSGNRNMKWDGISQKKECHLSGLNLLLIFSSKSNSVCRSSYGPMGDGVDYFFKACLQETQL